MTIATLTADEAVARLRPGMAVFVGGLTAEPLGIRAALRRNPEAAREVLFVGALLPGINDFDYATLHPTTRTLSGFVSPAQRGSFAAGQHELVHASYGSFTDVLAGMSFDMAFLATSRPNADGRLVFGLGADFSEVACRNASVIVAEMCDAIPGKADAPSIAADGVLRVDGRDGVVLSEPDRSSDPVSAAAAAHAASLVRDGDTIQIGIGRLPSLILRALGSHRRLGLHSGLATDDCLDLIEAGAMTGEAKTIDRGRAVTAGTMGSPRLYRSVAEGRFSIRPASYTHGLDTLRQVGNLVCLNSAIEVDLFGQVNSCVANGRLVSGIGGFPDFARGAALAPGGRAIVALPSVAKGRTRIVPALPSGALAAGTVLDIDFVVTEHGIAALRNTTLDERARRLVAIAAPEHRDTLQAAWRDLRARL